MLSLRRGEAQDDPSQIPEAAAEVRENFSKLLNYNEPNKR